MAAFISVKKHIDLDETDSKKLKSLYNELNEQNRKKVIKEAKTIRTFAYILSAFYILVFLAIGIIPPIITSISIKYLLIIEILPVSAIAYFGYKFYCASTWRNVEEYELLRLVDLNGVISLLKRQQQIQK